MDGRRIAVVIPTRNRSELAETALWSALSEARTAVAANPDARFRIVVSDNSTDPSQSDRVRTAVSGSLPNHPSIDVRYVRPAADLGMSDHWEWARKQTCGEGDISHVMYLTDRSLLLPGALSELLRAIEHRPDSVITFTNDLLDDSSTPVRLIRERCSGASVTVSSARLAFLTSQLLLPRVLPRMLNTLVPTPVLDRLEERFGSVFAGTAPDFCFCFRLLREVESMAYIDKALFLMHGLTRSNGASTTTGITSGDTTDFLAKRESQGGACPDTSLPEVVTTYNIICQEYVRAWAETPGKLQELDAAAYRRTLARETTAFADGPLKRANVASLERAGLSFGRGATLRRSAAHAAHFLRVLGPRDFSRQTVERLRSTDPIEFPTVAAALEWAMAHPTSPATSSRHLAFLTTTR